MYPLIAFPTETDVFYVPRFKPHFNISLTDLQKVLDVGTGTGIWAMSVPHRSTCLLTNVIRTLRCYSDFADQYPSAIVTGTDLSPIQPTWVPPNCRFEIDDAAGDWTFDKDSFDFIHARGLYGCIADWPAFYKNVYEYAQLSQTVYL